MKVRQDIAKADVLGPCALSVLTLGEAAEKKAYTSSCKGCRHHVRIDLVALVTKLGPDYKLENLRTRLRCEVCGQRGPIIACVDLDFYRSYLREPVMGTGEKSHR